MQRNVNSPKYLLLLSILFSIGIVTQSKCQDYSHLIPNEYKLRTIVIDAAHGGYDLGVVGNRLKEKDVNLQIALRLQTELIRYFPEVQVIQTRSSDQFIGIQERKNIAMRINPDLFISIHCSAGETSDYGSSILYPGLHYKETVAKEAMRINNSILLEDDYYHQYRGFDPSEESSYTAYAFPVQARANQTRGFANHLATQFRNNQRIGSVNQAGLLILNHNQFPSIAIQVGNLRNYKEENYFSSTGIQSTVALITQGIQSYKTYLDAQANEILRSKEEEIARIEAQKQREREAEEERKRLEELERRRKEESNWSWPSLRTINMSGTKYLVQLTTNKDYNITDFPFDNIVMSYIDVADQYKYLVGPYNSKEEASLIHKQAQEANYRSAFLLTYKDGKIVR